MVSNSNAGPDSRRRELGLMLAAVILSAPSILERLLRPTPMEDPEMEILVARQDLNWGQPIRHPETQFARKRVRQCECPEGAIRSLAVVTDRRLKRSLLKGDHVTETDLYRASEPRWSPEGDHIAVDIKVNLEPLMCIGVAGWAGSRVNVLLAIRSSTNDLSYVQVLLE